MNLQWSGWNIFAAITMVLILPKRTCSFAGPVKLSDGEQTGLDGLVLADIIRDAAVFKDILGELKTVEAKTALHIK